MECLLVRVCTIYFSVNQHSALTQLAYSTEILRLSFLGDRWRCDLPILQNCRLHEIIYFQNLYRSYTVIIVQTCTQNYQLAADFTGQFANQNGVNTWSLFIAILEVKDTVAGNILKGLIINQKYAMSSKVNNTSAQSRKDPPNYNIEVYNLPQEILSISGIIQSLSVCQKIISA